MKIGTLLADPTKDVSKLSVTQLKTVLRQNGVPKDQLSKMRKAELLVHKLQEILGKKLAPTIDDAKSAQLLADKAVATHRLCRLRTDLVVLVSHFLDTQSVVQLASCDHFLRARMTLAFGERASPALSSLRQYHSTRTLPRMMVQALLSRAQRLQSLAVKVEMHGRGFTAPSRSVLKQVFAEDKLGLDFPPSLTHLDLRANTALPRLLQAVRHWSALVSLKLSWALNDDNTDSKTPPTLVFPNLRSLALEDGGRADEALVVALLRSAPALRTLRLTDTFCVFKNVDAVMPVLRKLHTLVLLKAFNFDVDLKPCTNLRCLAFYACLSSSMPGAAVSALPPNLTHLCLTGGISSAADEDVLFVRHLAVQPWSRGEADALLRNSHLLDNVESLVIAAYGERIAETLQDLFETARNQPLCFKNLRRFRLDHLTDADRASAKNSGLAESANASAKPERLRQHAPPLDRRHKVTVGCG